MSIEWGKGSRSTSNWPERGIPVSDTQKKKYHESIVDLVSSLYLKSKYSDLTIVCDGQIFSAHKLILCSKSRYFQNKKTNDEIYLKEKEPILVEKMLEFLYTGDYTFERSKTKLVDTQTNGKEVTAIDPESPGDPTILIPEEPLVDEPTEAIACFSNETDGSLTETEATYKSPTAEEKLAEELVDEILMEESQAPIDKVHGQDLCEKGDAVELLVNRLTDCHPSYFHVLMYGEAIFFNISELRIKAKANFRASFMDCPERASFAKTIEKIYSTEGSYWRLKTSAIDMITDSLPKLWEAETPVIDKNLVNSVPDFGYDLWHATMNKYAAPADTPSSVALAEDDHFSKQV
ncbi:uncharacterized protein N7500_006587 [Penicillium coprophilum]|uniref:uncharacterized protein n=1 Tax=Penicillium coprophilum TaxID=36646 RepID=UPI00238B379F|nr:uncharacterized protein N7500_006587 [Penicillium coprophilum]KAJ5164757.1 hypothetical protein N7500_006587 [Penicillium coprophilum]